MGLMDILNGMQNGPRGQRQPAGKNEAGKNEGGMSPLTMALLGLLAYKAMKHMSGGSAGGRPAPLPSGGTTASLPGGNPGNTGGGLGEILGGNQIGRPQGGAPGSTGGGSLGDILGGLFGGRPAGMPGGAPTGGRSGGAPAGGRPGGGLDDLLRSGLGGVLGGAAAGTVLGGGLDELLKGFQQSGNARTAQSWVGKSANEDISAGDLEAALGGDTLDMLAQQTGMDRGDLLHGLSQQLPDFIDQLTPDGRLPTQDEWSRMV